MKRFWIFSFFLVILITSCSSLSSLKKTITGKIVYIKNNDIWTSNFDGTDEINITDSYGLIASEPSWSFDGTKIVFIGRNLTDLPRAGDVYVINYDGSFLRKLTYSESNRNPSWDPDGEHVVYISTKPHRYDVIRLNTTSFSKEILYSYVFEGIPFNPIYHPKISPDGKWIAFVESNSFVYLMDLNNGIATKLIGVHGYNNLDWSKDSSQILLYNNYQFSDVQVGLEKLCQIINDPDDPKVFISIYDLEKSKIIPLTNGKSVVSDAKWSPDGEAIMYEYTLCGTDGESIMIGDDVAKFFVMNTNGRQGRELKDFSLYDFNFQPNIPSVIDQTSIQKKFEPGQIIYKDDFQNEINWQLGGGDTKIFNYNFNLIEQNVKIDFDVKMSDDTDRFIYFIFYDEEDGEDFRDKDKYSIRLNNRGHFTMDKYILGEWVQLIPWAQNETVISSINFNHISVLRSQNFISFSVNDVVLMESNDVSITGNSFYFGGEAGGIVDIDSDPDGIFEIKNFIITKASQ